MSGHQSGPTLVAADFDFLDYLITKAMEASFQPTKAMEASFQPTKAPRRTLRPSAPSTPPLRD